MQGSRVSKRSDHGHDRLVHGILEIVVVVSLVVLSLLRRVFSDFVVLVESTCPSPMLPDAAVAASEGFM